MYLATVTVPTVVAAASAAAAVGSLLAYLYFSRRSEAHAARDEALALAETRREVIVDLRLHVAALEEEVAQLRAAREQAQEDAYRMQRFYSASLADLLTDVRADLESRPPDVDRVLARIRRLLDRPAA